MLTILTMILGLQEPAAAAPAATPAAPAEAQVALPRLTVRPVETSSDAGLAVGHTGSVFLEVDVQPDGTKGEVTIAESSRSEILDAEALKLISDSPLRGQSVPTRYRIEVQYKPYNFLEMDCRNFALQARWLRDTWPDKDIKETTLYTASVGLVTVMAMNGGGGTDQVLRGVREMEAKWPRVITECERQPNRPYAQVLLRVMG